MKCKTGGCWVHDGHGGHVGPGCGCDCHTPPRPPEGKHSPLPWNKGGDPGAWWIENKNGQICSRGYEGDGGFHDEADVDFICAAVNLHAKLVAALEELVNVVDPPGLKTGVQLEDYFIEPVKKARALLREAAK